MGYYEEVIADTPRHYWRLNDGTGATQLASALEGGWSLTPGGAYALAEPGLLAGSADKSVRFAGGYAESASTEAAPNVFGLECVFHATRGSAYLMGHASATAFDRHVYVGNDGLVYFGVYNNAQRFIASTKNVLDGKPHHLFAKAAAGGVLSLWLDGQKQAEGTFAPPYFPYSPSIRIGQLTLGAWAAVTAGANHHDGWLDEVAVYHHSVADARIVRHALLAATPHKLAGSAVLDSGVAATRVFVRGWVGGELVGSVVPAPDGAWSVNVTPGEYEVTARGPAGYQPITHGPVTAVEA